MEALADPSCGWFYRRDAGSFSKIPGSPIAYWASVGLLDSFKSGIPLEAICQPKKGLGTGNKDLFMRYWWEPSQKRIFYNANNREEAMGSGCRWFPHNKGGEFRKWFGNSEYVVNWENDGNAIKRYKNDNGQLAARPQNQDCYFRECVTWSKISSGRLAFRYKHIGGIFNEVAPAFFGDKRLILGLEGYLNSSVCNEVAKALSPTLDFQVGQVATYPVELDTLLASPSSEIAADCTTISKADWDSLETSRDFRRHPLI